jgi:hypothetical protein
MLMNGLPEAFDASFLVGASLVQVCVGLHEVILRFAEDIDVTIECDVDVVTTTGAASMGSAPEIGRAFVAVLGQRITAAHGSPGGDLAIELGAARFVLHDSSASYESYQVRHGDHLVVV